MNSSLGHWQECGSPDIVAVHMALLRSGKVLLFTGDERNTFRRMNSGKSVLWDPATGADQNVPLSRNLFCSGHCALPDGRLLVVGGQSLAQDILGTLASLLGLRRGVDHDIHTFDPLTETWTRHQDMPRARWYPSCTVLPDGRALIVSGFHTHALDTIVRLLGIKLSAVNEDHELFDPATNGLAAPQPFLPGISLYPFVYVLPGGALFVHSQNKTRLLDLEGFTWLPGEFPTTTPGTRTYPGQGACVLLPITWDGHDLHNPQQVRLLIVGGSTALNPTPETPATSAAEIFAFEREDPASSGWRATAPLARARFMSDAVLLPDGTVFVGCGAGRGQADHNHDAVRACELFDPASETWQPLADMHIDRLYHSTAVLLPDARVLVGGSTGHHFPDVDNEFRLEVFSPPYLERGPQPQITAAPERITHNQPFEVQSPQAAAIRHAALLRPGTSTHTTDMDQRHVRLPIESRQGDRLTIKAPLDATIAPPGYYMLFLLDEAGVPSVARFVQVQ